MRGVKPQLRAIEGGLSKVPPTPKGLAAEGRNEWRKVSEQLITMKLLKQSDLHALEHYCIASGMVKRLQIEANKVPPILCVASGAIKTHPAHTMLARYLTIAKNYESELGLTPASRNRKGIKQGGTRHADTPPDLDL